MGGAPRTSSRGPRYRGPLALVLAGLVVWLGSAQGKPRGAVYTVCASACDWSSVAQVNAAQLQPRDTVLFKGGEVFPGTLVPGGSGTNGAPITFTSYGGAPASLPDGISLGSVSFLRFENLLVDGGTWKLAGMRRGIVTRPKPSAGARNVVVRGCTFRNVLQAILSMNPGDSGWTVKDNLFQRTGDSAVIIHDEGAQGALGGSGWVFEGNQILDSGLDYASLGYPLHGIYSIARNTTVRKNLIRGFQDSGVSLRAQGGVVEGNAISRGPIGVSFSPYDAQGRTTRIAYNRLTDLRGGGSYAIVIFKDSSYRNRNPESFVVVSNTAVDVDAGIRVVGAASATVKNNAVVLAAGGNPVLAFDNDVLALSESHNLWYRPGGGAAWSFRYKTYASLGAYQSASKLGQSDRDADPLLDATHAPAAGSPVVDGGTKKAGLKYAKGCDGGLYRFCGKAPDMGAVESTQSGGARAAQTDEDEALALVAW